MAQNKEHLQALLKFLDSLIKEPGNEWFIEELQKMVGVPEKTKSSVIFQNGKIDSIEKYLGIDFKVDSMHPVVDFSFVKNEELRNQLIADNREMLRYRYGVRAHTIDFEEFCRYVIMQVELLLNYYYSTKTSDTEEAKALILTHYDKARLESAKTVNEIALAAKLIAYTNQYGLKDVNSTLNYVRDVRNAQSHRGIEEEDAEFVYKIRKMLQQRNYPLTKEGEVDWWNLKKNNEQQYNIFCNTIQSTPEYKRYKSLLWRKRKPFSEVLYKLEKLAEHIKNNIR